MGLKLPAALLAILLVTIGIVLAVRSFLSSEEAVEEAAVTLPDGQGLSINGVPVTADSHSPAEVTVGFYTWYLTGLGLNPRFDASQEFSTYVTLWLTPSFAGRWERVAEDTNADPFLLAQDFSSAWAKRISTATENKSSMMSIVRITLGTGPEAHSLQVTLVNGPQGWRIDSVAPAS